MEFAPTVETDLRVGFTLRIVSPKTGPMDYHSALDTLMRALLTCFGSAHAEGGPDGALTRIYTQTYDVPTEAQFEQLEDAVVTINTAYPALYANFL